MSCKKKSGICTLNPKYPTCSLAHSECPVNIHLIHSFAICSRHFRILCLIITNDCLACYDLGDLGNKAEDLGFTSGISAMSPYFPGPWQCAPVS